MPATAGMRQDWTVSYSNREEENVKTDLKDKVVLVTGSGGGIGRMMARAFAEEGAHVIINDIDAKGVATSVEEIGKSGGKASAAQCDITQLDAVIEMIARIEKEHQRVDVLINNAALLIAHEMFVDTNPADCDREIKVILYGTMNCTRAVLPGMIARKFGKIVNIVTDAARAGQERQCNYSAAKGGIISFTKSLAKEIGRHNININAISPGATNSPMRAEMLRQLREKVGDAKAEEREEKVKRAYALRRIGEPEDISNAAIFLSSSLGRHITGQVLSVNGGFAMLG